MSDRGMSENAAEKTEHRSIYGSGLRNGKTENENRLLIRFVKLLDVAVILLFYYLIWMRFYVDGLYASPFFRRGNWIIILIYLLSYVWLAHLYQGFYIHLLPVNGIIFGQTLACVFANLLMYFVTVLLSRRFVNVFPMLLCLLLDFLFICVWSKWAHDWHRKHYARKKVIIIYDKREGVEELIREEGLDTRYKVLASVPVSGVTPEYFEDHASKAQIIFLCGVHSHERNQILKACIDRGIQVFIIPRIGDVLMMGAVPLHMLHLPILMVNRYNPPFEYVALKRFFDIVLSALALVLLSPLMIVLTILIRRDGGSAFYHQVRLTKDGREFELLKFRSMRADAEKDGVARLSTGEEDPRITKIGRFIRSCRMDEIPQLINILKGDMSIVGPRPERPEIAAQYEKSLPEFSLRLQCKCGLTGYAQVYGKYNTTPYDKLLMDLTYISNASFAEDIRICFATVKILFLKESTEGVAEGQTTASFQKPERSVKEETDVQTQHIAEEAEQKHNI